MNSQGTTPETCGACSFLYLFGKERDVFNFTKYPDSFRQITLTIFSLRSPSPTPMDIWIFFPKVVTVLASITLTFTIIIPPFFLDHIGT
jgi:hypothetical protein